MGIALPAFARDSRVVVQAAIDAEALELDGCFLFDHLFSPECPPGHSGVDPLVALGAVLDATTRIAAGTLVFQAARLPPVVAAEAFVSADKIGPGRLVAGLGLGDEVSEREARYYGMRRPSRRERLDDLENLSELLSAAGIHRWFGGRGQDLRAAAARHGAAINLWEASIREVSAARDGLAEGIAGLTWAGAAVVGTSQSAAESRAERRRRQGGAVAEPAVIGGPATIADFCSALGNAGADWVVLAPRGVFGESDRRDSYRAVAAIRRLLI